MSHNKNDFSHNWCKVSSTGSRLHVVVLVVLVVLGVLAFAAVLHVADVVLRTLGPGEESRLRKISSELSYRGTIILNRAMSQSGLGKSSEKEQ